MKLKFPFALVAALAAVAIPTLSYSVDWTHIMGPNNNRKTAEEVPAKWTDGKPRKVWEISADGGFSSFVTGDGKAYTVLPVRDRETVLAVHRKTGKTLWQTTLNTKADYDGGGERGAPGNLGGDGPRATPVFADGRVFVFGGNFDLYALRSSNGEIIWKRDLLKEFDGDELSWSNSAAPLVVGDRVLVAGGGKNQSYLAFRADNGQVLWKSGSDRATHATPVLATIHGQRQALFMSGRGVVSLDPENGQELWHYPFAFRTSVGASPVVWNDIVNCTAGYGVGGGACRVTREGDKWSVEEIWRSPGNRETASHWSTAVAHDGYLYGCYGHYEPGKGAFKCIDIRTGKVMWQRPGFGHGQVIMAGERLVVTSDAGVLTMIEPNPTEYRELAKAHVIDGKVWASPALSDGQLFLRSTTKGVCLEF